MDLELTTAASDSKVRIFPLEELTVDSVLQRHDGGSGRKMEGRVVKELETVRHAWFKRVGR